MSLYDYFTFGIEDAYGQPQISETPQGKIKMAINLTNQSIQDNINYKDSQYVGLTMNNEINDTYVIQYGEQKLKVLFVNPFGRYNQVFMSCL